MKLYVIGTSPQANIQLHSQYGSGYHAELLLLDNGDMLLTDRGSKNGTYVNGNKITPDKDVNVRRGDEIVFADERLDWNRIPVNTVDLTKVKEIRSIGSHHLNRILVQGEHVSRFHATMKKMSDGKWYIQDHSKNGTTINGNRIPKDQDVRIKKGDKITCAGVPVQNPIVGPSVPWRIIGGVAAAVACVALFLIIVLPNITSNKEDAVVYIQGTYRYDVYVGDVVVDSFSKNPYTGKPLTYSGTGFFISQSGKIVTNLHVAKPWLYEKISTEYETDLRDSYKESAMWVSKLAETDYEMDIATSRNKYADKIRVVGVINDIYVIPNNRVFAPDNALTASVISSSKNTEVDLAILQLDIEQLPDGADYVRLNSISKSPDDVKVGDKIYTIGFPAGVSLQLSGDNINEKDRIKMEAYRTDGHCIRSGNNVNFEHNAMIEGGASGSPVFKKGKVVGVVSAKWGDTQYNIAIDAALIHPLLENIVEF